MFYNRGVLTTLADLVRYIAPVDKPSDWDNHESAESSSERSASTVYLHFHCSSPPPFLGSTPVTIAAITLFDKVIKRHLVNNIQLIPLIRTCPVHESIGVRLLNPWLPSGVIKTLRWRLEKRCFCVRVI